MLVCATPCIYGCVGAGTYVGRKTRMEVYADRELHSDVSDAADESGMSVSKWMREAARQKLQRELKA